MYVWSSHTAEYGSTREGCQSCSWSAEQGKWTFSCARLRLRIWSRETGSAVPSRVSLLILRAQAEPGAVYLRDSSRVLRRRPFIYLKPPYAIGSVPSLSGHAIAYRWRLLPRVRRHRASKPRDSSERVLPRQVHMNQICASLCHTHYWYKVGALKVPSSRLIPAGEAVCAWSSRLIPAGDAVCAWSSRLICVTRG